MAIEVVDTKPKERDLDPDLVPYKDKPILKLFWNATTKSWEMHFDQSQFPNLEFIVAGLQDRSRFLEQQIRMSNEMRFGQAIASQQQMAQLAQQIRQNNR
jgi:hypothetical protein